MTTNFGTDLYSVEDVDESRTVSGVALVAQDAYWALQTPTNQGIDEVDAPGRTMDLEGEIGNLDETTGSGAAALPDKIRTTLKEDERILDVNSTVNRTVRSNGLVDYDINIRCETAEGPFALVAKVGDEGFSLAVTLLPGDI